MKRLKVFHALVFMIILVIARILSGCGLGVAGNEPCHLPAPENLKHEFIQPDSVKFNWNAVNLASSYRLILIDSTVQDTLANVISSQTERTLGGLIPGHLYKAAVRSVCQTGSESDQSTEEVFLYESIIIGDVVVMRENESGLMDCNCGSGTPVGTYGSAYQDVSLFTTTSAERKVYKLEVQNGAVVRTFKMAFDYSCQQIKVYTGKCNEPEENEDITLIATHTGILPNAVQVSVPSVLSFLIRGYQTQSGTTKTGKLIIENNGTAGSVTVTECPPPSGGSWTEVCP